MSNIGKIYRVRKWDHCTPNTTLSYGLGRERKNEVVLMVCLGVEPLDGSKPIDLEQAMKELGWVPATPAAAAPPEGGEKP